MLIFDQSKANRWRGVLCIGLLLSLWSCAPQQEVVDLKPHVNRLVLRVNELANQVYDLENRLKSSEKSRTQVPDHIRRLADLEVTLAHLKEEVHAHFMAEQEKTILWEKFDQKLLNLQQKVEQERKKYQAFQQDTMKKIHELSLGLDRLASQEEKKSDHLSTLSVPPDKTGKKEAYEEAYKVFVDGDVSKAREKFQTFLLLYPDSTLANNAQFWIGECYYDQKEYERAIIEYEKVIQKYPHGSKVPSALLKQGFSFYALGKVKEAEILFDQVIKKAPQSEQAQIAKNKLKSISKKKSQ